MATAIASGRCIFMLCLSKGKRTKQKRPSRNRTGDLHFRRVLLCQLSYRSVVGLSGVIAKATPHSYWCYPDGSPDQSGGSP